MVTRIVARIVDARCIQNKLLYKNQHQLWASAEDCVLWVWPPMTSKATAKLDFISHCPKVNQLWARKDIKAASGPWVQRSSYGRIWQSYKLSRLKKHGIIWFSFDLPTSLLCTILAFICESLRSSDLSGICSVLGDALIKNTFQNEAGSWLPPHLLRIERAENERPLPSLTSPLAK
jgi:hypothetical protein